MPLANDKLLVAAQYAYVHRLSKPYTNQSNDWDWRYPEPALGEDVFAPPPVGTNPIWRPNHGLAHSARGAMYAPTVIDYFKSVTNESAYNFSEDDIEKIQIALMFRVTGRENESGFSDDKVAYASYQEGHAKNFRAYCQANPGVFKDNAEIEKFAEVLRTYANPSATSPLAIIFKTCHNLDLIRVRDPDGLKKELAIPTQLLGETNVKQLMLYADSCIRATGSRILCSNPIIGRGSIGYEDGVFRVASTNPAQCIQIIENIPKPPKPIVEVIPAKDVTPLKDALLNYNTNDIQNAAIALYSLNSPFEIMYEVDVLMQNKLLTEEAKERILDKTSILLKTILKYEIPLTQYKPLVEYLTNGAKGAVHADNVIVKSYIDLLDTLDKQSIPPAIIDDFKTSLITSANEAALENQKSLDKQVEAAVKPALVIDAESIIQQDLFDDPKTPDVADTIKSFADALKQKNIEHILGINLSDLTSQYRSDVVSVRRYMEFTTKISESVTNDLLTAKSTEHQAEIFLYYVRVMQQCMLNKDFNSVSAIYKGLAQSQRLIAEMRHAINALPSNDLKNMQDCGHFLQRKNPNSYFHMNKNDIDIPIMSAIVVNLNNATKTLATTGKDGANRVDMKAMTDAGRIYQDFEQCRDRLRDAAITSSVVDVSRIDQAKITTAAKKEQLMKRMNPGTHFDLDHLDKIPKLTNALNKFTELLNDHLKVPINITVVLKGVKCGAITYEMLIQYLEKYKSALETKAKTSPQPKELYEKLAILALSIQEYGANNKTESPATLARIQAVQNLAVANGVTPDVQQLREGQRRINQFKLGKPSLTNIDIPLPMGPLYKVNYTVEYEELIKGMLVGTPFTVAIVNKQAIITMNGNEYNLQKIVKFANLNHLNLSDADKAAYLKMISDNAATLKFPPCFPPASSPPVRSVADLYKLNDKFNDPKNTELVHLTIPERMALNIYTTGFYDTVNPFLRGRDADKAYLDTNFVRELICHAGMAVNALNKITDEVPIVSFRAESSDPNNIPAYMQNRIDAAKTGGVTLESGFVSTAQEIPALNFGNPDTPGGVGIIYKDLKGKNVRNLSAFDNEREFLMPPTQIQWSSYIHAKEGHILEGKPVTTPLNLAPEAMSIDPFTPEKQAKLNATDKLYTDKIAITNTPKDFVLALLNIPNGVKDKNGVDVDVHAIFGPIAVVLSDPKLVADINDNPLSFVKQLVKDGVSNQFGILSKFLKIVEVQHDMNLRQKAEQEFFSALKAATSVDEMIECLKKFSKNSFINIGNSNELKLMIEQMEEIANSPKVAHEIFNDGTLPFDQCDQILSNYGIKDVFFELVAKQYEHDMDNAIANIQNAMSLNELIDVVRTNIKDMFIEMDPVIATKMIDTMRHFANNPEMVHAIAKQGDKSMLFKNSGITADYGISQQFIRLAVQQDLRQQLTTSVVNARNANELIQILEASNIGIVDDGGGVDKIKMIQIMKDILKDKDLLQYMVQHPNQKDLFFKGSSVTPTHGIRERFAELAKNHYQEHYLPKPAITRQKAVTFSPIKTEPATNKSLAKPTFTKGVDITTHPIENTKKKL